MLIDSYKTAMKLVHIYQQRFPGLDVESFAFEVALKYADYEEREGAKLPTVIGRCLLGRLINECKRIKREMRLESRKHELNQNNAMEPLQFIKLSKMAQLLLKQMMVIGSSSQWECYQELHQRGWTREVFLKYINELRRKYVPKNQPV